MTDYVLELIDDINDLKLLSKAYKKGALKLNQSKLARELGVDRGTIRNKLLDDGVPKERKKKEKYLDNYKDIITSLLNNKHRYFEYKEHLYNYMVREHSITCSRTTFVRYLNNDNDLKDLFNTKQSTKFTERFETAPGQQVQFDLKEKIPIVLENGATIRIFLATITFGFSRYNIRKLVLDTKYETIVNFFASSFEEIGGVPKEMVIDNIKCLVDKARGKNGEEAILNSKFVEFLKDYNIECKPCMPRRPETKGKTETQNKKPGQIRNYSGTFRDILEIHEKVKMLNDEDNNSISQATHLPRIFLFNTEKDELSPLPSKKIREKYHLTINEVAVSNESLVSYKSNKYSVPKSLIGAKVNLVVQDKQLRVYYNSKIIVVHEISNKLLNIHKTHNLSYESKETLNDVLNNDIQLNNDSDIKDSNEKKTSALTREMENIKYD